MDKKKFSLVLMITIMVIALPIMLSGCGVLDFLVEDFCCFSPMTLIPLGLMALVIQQQH